MLYLGHMNGKCYYLKLMVVENALSREGKSPSKQQDKMIVKLYSCVT